MDWTAVKAPLDEPPPFFIDQYDNSDPLTYEDACYVYKVPPGWTEESPLTF